MRLLKFDGNGELDPPVEFIEHIPNYAILSHTWGPDVDEVTFNDLQNGTAKTKPGYTKLQFCGEQARRDGIEYFWVDAYCIQRANFTELSEAIISMFRWYRNATKCYVYLSDVSVQNVDPARSQSTWMSDFEGSRWFTRGWTLQELIAPAVVEFFSREGKRLGDKITLEEHIHKVTRVPITALRGIPLAQFTVDERLEWAANRKTLRDEDKAYCLLGIFDVFIPLIYGEGENAFRRLREELNKPSKAMIPECRNVHWTVNRSANTMFTGRENTLGRLEAVVRAVVRAALLCKSSHEQARIVITGIGGQGKSETCIQLAHRVRSLHWGIFWLDVGTPSTAENGFMDIASRLQIPVSTWEDGRQSLANVSKPWMLVLDNADDVNFDYQVYFPTGSSGVVVLTSRNAQCKQYATAEFVALEGLPEHEARELVLKSADISSDQHLALRDDAGAIAALLQSHPLALIQAGAYVARGHCSLADYPQVYERQRKRLLTFRPSQAQSRYCDVYTTFEASVQILQNSDVESVHDALQLLRLLAICGPHPLPPRFFEAAWKGAQSMQASSFDKPVDLQLTNWHFSHLPGFMNPAANRWDSFRLVEAVHTLTALALLSTNIQDGHMSISMHPLVHAWARDRQSEQQQHESWISMACICAFSRSDTDLWRQYGRQLQPHIHAITSWGMPCIFGSEPKLSIARILENCGWLMYDMGDHTTLYALLSRLCAHLEIDQQTVDAEFADLYLLIGRNLSFCYQFNESLSVLEQVDQIHASTLAESHPSRLAAQCALARIYQWTGKEAAASTLLERAVQIYEQEYAEGHPDRLSSQRWLAEAYQANGQDSSAVALLEKVVRIYEQNFPEDQSHRLASQQALASVYDRIGQTTKAVALLEKVVQIRERSLAEDHPHRLSAQHKLAEAYYRNGEDVKAATLLERVVWIREQTLPEEDPGRISSVAVLAKVYQANGHAAKAIAMLEKVVQIHSTQLAEDSVDRLGLQVRLARAYHKNRQVTKAIPLLERVVRIGEQAFPQDKLDLLRWQESLGEAYKADGQIAKAVALLEKVVQVGEQRLPEDSMSLLRWQESLAEAYYHADQFGKSVALLEKVSRIDMQRLPADHHDRLSSQRNLALVLEQWASVRTVEPRQ